MTKEEKYIKATIVFCVVFLGLVLFFTLTPTGRNIWNKHTYELKKIDDMTLYDTRKKVEDSCRTMISNYTADKLIWEQYKDSDNQEKISWAEQAKMRANKTAAGYNEYVLKNSYVWEGNIPKDIQEKIEYIQ